MIANPVGNLGPVRAIGASALALGVVASPLLIASGLSYLVLPLLLSIIVLGLPHGSVDFQIACRLWDLQSVWNQILFVLVYLAAVGLYAVFWIASPGLAFISFLALTIYHWGAGDRAYEEHVNPESSPPGWVLTLLRGSIPVCLPILFWPDVVAQVAGWTTALFPESLVQISAGALIHAPWTRLLIASVLIGLLVASLARDLRDHRRGTRGAATRATETVGLTLFFAVVHPLVAIGLYFPFWHSLRHLDRLRSCLGSRRSKLGWSTIFRHSLPMTLGAVGILLLLTIGLSAGGTLTSLTGVYLVLLAILTLPHAIVIEFLDTLGTAESFRGLSHQH